MDAQSLAFFVTLNAANTAGMNPAIRALALGMVGLSEQPGAGPADAHTFSTSARRGLHALTLFVGDVLPPYALALPALETLSVGVDGALAITAHSFAGLDNVTCINCGGRFGVANFTGLGLRSSSTPGDLSLLAYSDLFNISGISSLDLTANSLTSIGQHDFDGATYLTHLYIGSNPSLTYIHCAAFTAAQQPLLTANSIDETGNTASTWRAGCPSPSVTPAPAVTAASSATKTPTHTRTATPSRSATPTHVVAAAASSSGLSKSDQFAVALSLGLLSVAFIVALLFFLYRRRRAGGAAGVLSNKPPASGVGVGAGAAAAGAGSRRTVIRLVTVPATEAAAGGATAV